MKTFFTKYLFLLFIVPILILIIFVLLILSGNLTIGNNVDIALTTESAESNFLRNPYLNNLIFYITYLVYFTAYFAVFILRKKTDYKLSVAHYSTFLTGLIAINFNATNIINLPIIIICFVFFILNIFKSKNIKS